jgi:hypothetical protein
MPYAHKYANAATELGMIGALRSFLPDENPLKAALQGGVAVARKDIASLGSLLIDAEMKMFHDLPTPAIFLQNAATDFLLGLGLDVALRAFADHVRERYAVKRGFITMNLPMLLPRLEKLGIEWPYLRQHQQDRIPNLWWSAHLRRARGYLPIHQLIWP